MKIILAQQEVKVNAWPCYIGEIEIQNCFDITKLYLVQELAEIKEYKDRYNFIYRMKWLKIKYNTFYDVLTIIWGIYMYSYMSVSGKGSVSTITTMTTTSSSAQSIADEHKEGGLTAKTLAELQQDGEVCDLQLIEISE